MKFYCAECWEEIGNCAPWCGEAARERNQGAVAIPETDADNDPEQMLEDEAAKIPTLNTVERKP
jgi:hypothetical protein